jgi:hypothetical protein
LSLRLSFRLVGPVGLNTPYDDRRRHARREGHDKCRQRKAQPPSPPPLDRGQFNLVQVTRPPIEDGRGQHVVVDLEGIIACRPHDPCVTCCETSEHVRDRLRLTPDILGKVVDPMGDLGPRGSDEEAEEGGRDFLLVRAQACEGNVQVGADDSLGAAEALEGLETEPPRPRPSFLVPEPDEDELEIGRLDLPPAGAARGIRPVEHARAGIGECDPTDLDLVEHALDQRRLRGDGIVGMGCGVEGDRREDRLTRGVP